MPQLHARGESVIQNIRKRARQQRQKNDAAAAPAQAPKKRWSAREVAICGMVRVVWWYFGSMLPVRYLAMLSFVWCVCGVIRDTLRALVLADQTSSTRNHGVISR